MIDRGLLRMKSNFSFMNELAISSSIVQTNVQNFVEQATIAQLNFTKNIWMALCSTREAAEYACRIIVLKNEMSFTANGLQGYVGRANAFTRTVDTGLLEDLKYISSRTTKAHKENGMAAKEAIERLYQVAKKIYGLLGGKEPVNPPKLNLDANAAVTKNETIPTVAQLFDMIEKPIKEGIIKDGLDGGAGKVAQMEKTIDDILELLKQGDSKFISKDEFQGALKKLEDGMKRQFEFGQSEVLRKNREIETKLDAIERSMGKNAIQMDDLEAKLTLLLTQMDGVQTKQQNNMEYVAKIMESTDKILDNFVKINEQNLAALSEGTKFILKEIKKASDRCADIFNHFSEEMKASNQKYQESRNRKENNPARELKRNSASSSFHSPNWKSWKLPGLETVFRFAKTWQITEKCSYYTLAYTLAVLMLFSWFGISYTGFKQEMNQVLLWKAGLIFWYFITWSIGVLVKVCFGFTLFRMVCYGITYVRSRKKFTKKQAMMLTRRLIFALLILNAGLYIHRHFYEMAQVFVPWKQTLLADTMEMIQYYFREIFYNWGR